MGTTASLQLRFSTPGLSETRKDLSALKRDAKDTADATRSMVADMTASIDRLSNARRKQTDEERTLREARIATRNQAVQDTIVTNKRIRELDAEIAKLKELERAVTAQARMDRRASSGGGYGPSRNNVDLENEKILKEWLAAKDRRVAEVAAAERVQSDARLRRLREESDAVVRAEREAVASAKRAASERAAAERAAERETMRVNNASVAERRRAEREAAAQKRREDSDYTAWWKRQIAERERAEKEGLQRIAAADRAIRERMRQSASTTQSNGSSLDFLDKAALWATGLNQTLNILNQIVGVAGSFVQEAAKWESITLALENMEGGATNASTAISHLYEIAKAPGIDLATAQHAYLKLRAVSISGAEAERVIKDFSNTVARGGGGSLQFGRVLEQFTQMRAENRVLQQDLKFMKNSMPELASLMEKAFGTTTAAGIRKLGLNARQFTEGILAEMEKLPKAQQTLTSEIENTGTAWSRLKAAFVDTDMVKSKLQGLTKVFESLRTSIAGSPRERMEADINAKYGNQITTLRNYKKSPLPWLMSKVTGSDPRLEDDAYRGQLAGELEKQRRAELEVVDKMYRPFDMGTGKSQDTKDKEEAASAASEKDAEKAKSEAKEAARQIKREQEALQKQLDANRIKLEAEAAYQKTLDSLRREGYSDSEAAIVANTQKELSIISDNLEAQLKEAHGSRKLEEEARKQSEELQINSQLEMKTKLAEIRKKDRDDKEKQRLKEMADIRTRLAEIQKAEQEANDKLEALDEAELNRRDALYDSVAESYESEIDLINRHAEEKLAILDSIGRRTIDLENKINAEREVKVTEYYEKQLRAALDGAEALTGSVADVYKTGIDRDYDRKKKAVEKTLSIDGLEGAARLAGKQKLDSALERLEAEHEAKMQGTYKTLFTIQKSFAIASATVQLASAAIKAMAMSGSVWEQLANAGAVMAAGGALVSTISSATYSGMYDKGGYIPRGSYGIAGENGPEIITGPARVTSTRDTARIMSGNSQPVVNVYNNAGVDVETRTNSKGELEVMINKVVEAAESRIASGIGSGSGGVDRALRSTYGLNRGR